MPLLHGKCTYSSRICEAFTTLSATDEQDFVALLVALVKARLYDTALGYDITKQRLTTSAENRIHKCISFFPPVGSKRFDYPPPCFRRRRALSIQGFSLQQETRSNL